MQKALLVAAAVLSLFAACDVDKAPKSRADDELTIVVQQDKSRIAAEEAALADQRRALQKDREDLRADIDQLVEQKGASDARAMEAQARDLLKKAAKLVRDQDDLATRGEQLTQQRNSLIDRVTATGQPAPAAGPAAAGVQAGEVVRAAAVTREVAQREKGVADRERGFAERERSQAGREKEVAEREKTLAEREAAVGLREASAGVQARRTGKDKGLEVSRSALEKAYKRLVADMDAKGIVPSDLPPDKQAALHEANAARVKGDLVRAMEAVEVVAPAVDALVIDSDFVSQKARRVNALQAKAKAKDPKAQEEIARLLQSATQKHTDGQYVEANRAFTSIVRLLEKGGRP